MNLLLAILLGFALTAPNINQPSTRFEVGQVWSLKSPAPEGMRIRIGRIDDWEGVHVVSITITEIPCPPGLGCETTVVGHAPFDELVLAASVDRLVSEGAPADESFEAGYAQWREARGGAFTIPPAQVAEMAVAQMAAAVAAQGP